MKQYPSLAALLLLLVTPATGQAQATLLNGFGGAAGFGPNGQCLSPNDDGSSASIDITPYFPSGLRFFDQTHTALFVNTNGNITFSDRVSTYTPTPFPVADQPMIAPFWGDVDIRRTGGSCMGSDGLTCSVCEPCHNPSENGVWWHFESGRMIFTWDRVGRYDCSNAQRNSFQLVLTAAANSCGGAGDFDVEFRYNRCEWEVGEASGDDNNNGICDSSDDDCTPAQAGFDAGNQTDFVEIMGSRMNGIHTRLCTESNVGETGIWRFQIRSGAVVCPDAGDACDTGMMGVCSGGRTNCVGDGTECVQDVTAGDERCDALDNDCDGTVDEGSAICPANQVCTAGTCLSACFELGCPEGQVCTDDGQCIDAACVDVSCPEGQRCRGGSCVGACDGVTCPAGLSCRGGSCVDLCADLTCDDCTVCGDGLCVPSCEFEDCAAGETCQPDGSCVESACATVTCDPGSFCQAGACVDSCTGAVCPAGEECRDGTCQGILTPDAGPPPPPVDAGPLPDAGSRPDAGPGGSGMDAGRVDGGPRFVGPSGSGAGCACRAGAPTPLRSRSALAFLGLLALVWVGRRRR